MDPGLDEIRQDAASWFSRRRDGALAPDEEETFEHGRRRDEAHARVYAETERAWEQWEHLQSSTRMREMTAAALAATAPKRRAARKSWRPLLLAASVAAVAVKIGRASCRERVCQYV